MYSKLKKIFAVASILTVLFFASAYPANAACVEQSDGTYRDTATGKECFQNPLGPNSTFEGLLANIGGQLTILAIPILAIVIIYGAFLIMTSEGSEEKYAKGKKVIIYGIMGFIILILGSGIGFIIKEALTG